MSIGADVEVKRACFDKRVIPPIRRLPPAISSRKFGIDLVPDSARQRQFIHMVVRATNFLVTHRDVSPLPINKNHFQEVWIFVAIVRDPGLLWTGNDRHTTQTVNKIRRCGNILARFLNPSWSTDFLKEFLESETVVSEMKGQLELLRDLGRYEDWVSRLPNHKASRDLVEIRR